MNAQHLCKSHEWGTPDEVLAGVERVFGMGFGGIPGNIDMDVCSSEVANERVKAERYLSVKDNVLWSIWPTSDNVFCNPPSGTVHHKGRTWSMGALFFKRFVNHIKGGMAKHGIFVCPSLELIQKTQQEEYGCPVAKHAFCVPSKRLQFVPLGGQKVSRPTHANAIVYVRGLIDMSEYFADIFGELGTVSVPRRTR